jgi:16S rRNA (adenine1518-N6/adenine1519-N6)-dimethyltransferase
MLQLRYRMVRLFDVPRGAFNPPPKVTSSIVRMVPKAVDELPHVDLPLFGAVVAAAFNQRRKILRNALSELAGDEVFSAAAVDPLARAETLAVEDFVRLARSVEASRAQR